MKYRDRLLVWESDYGRSEGWDLELDGRIVAFWDSYCLRATTDDPVLKERVLSEEFWKGDDCFLKLVYRSRATGFVAEHPLPARGFTQLERISIRGLYISVGDPAPWDWIVLYARSFVRWCFWRLTKQPH